jgi:hypothetical protein
MKDGNTIIIEDGWKILEDKCCVITVEIIDEWDDEEEVKEEPPKHKELIDVDVKTEMKHMFPMPILLKGDVGVGKSTIVMELAEELGLTYYAAVLTDGTSKNEFTGYKNVMDGSYIGGEFRQAFEFGGLFNLEEINAAQANLAIIFNTIENGYFVFADKIVYAHKDFRLVATMNNITNAKDFGGRRQLDKSVSDRFHHIDVKGDIKNRYHSSTIAYMERVNQILESKGITDIVTPRDMKRYEHMVSNKYISKEMCIKKCMFNGRMEPSDDMLRTIIKGGKEWK